MEDKRISIRMDPSLYKRISRKAEAEQRSLNSMVVRILDESLGDHELLLPKPKRSARNLTK